jgi:glycosyltransferase involved in cell wall biosynthesis
LGAAVESLAAGVPTIATRVGGFPDIVIDGETGWLAESKSPSSLAGTIAKVLGQSEEAMRRAGLGRKLIEEQLDVKIIAAQVFKHYQDYLSEGL